MSGEPKQADDGKLWTPGAVDFFRIVNEQVSVVEEVSSGEMLLQTGHAVMGIMKEFQVRLCILCLVRLRITWERTAAQQKTFRASPAVQLFLQTDFLEDPRSLCRTDGKPKARHLTDSVEGLPHCKRALLSHRRQGRRSCRKNAALGCCVRSAPSGTLLQRVQRYPARALARHEAGQP